MNLLVTGANGFLGRYVVSEALRHGHAVRALVRPTADVSDSEWTQHGRLEIVRADMPRENRDVLASFSESRNRRSAVGRVLGVIRSGVYRQTIMGNIGLLLAALTDRI